MKIRWASLTDKGPVRERNEDTVFGDPLAGVFIVADGVGGRAGGEFASDVTVDSVQEVLHELADPGPVRETAHRAILSAHETVVALAEFDSANEGMASTICLLWLGTKSTGISHVGDSRAYRWRRGQLTQLTTDDVMPGETSLTQAIGVVGLDPQPSWIPVKPRAGEVFLLCSDGLSGVVSDEQMADLITHGRDDLDALARLLIAEAIREGTRDNVSVVLVRIDRNGDGRPWFRVMAALIGFALGTLFGSWLLAHFNLLRYVPGVKPALIAGPAVLPYEMEPAGEITGTTDTAPEIAAPVAAPPPATATATPTPEDTPTTTATWTQSSTPSSTPMPTAKPSQTPAPGDPLIIDNLLERFRMALEQVNSTGMTDVFVNLTPRVQSWIDWEQEVALPGRSCLIELDRGSIKAAPNGGVSFTFTFFVRDPGQGYRTQRVEASAMVVARDGTQQLLLRPENFNVRR
jgi:PPM family protein phosphatase